MPWWYKSSKNKGRNSLPDVFSRHFGSSSPSSSPRNLRRNSNDELARQTFDCVLVDSPSPSPSSLAPRRSVDQFAQPLPLPQTPTETTTCNSPSNHGNGNAKGSTNRFYDLPPLLPLPSPKQILSKDEGEEFLGYVGDSLSSDGSLESVEGVTPRVLMRYNNGDLCKGHTSNGDIRCNCASYFDNIGSKMPKHDSKQRSGTLHNNKHQILQDDKLSGSQPIKITKKEQRGGNNQLILEAKSAPTTGFSSPILSPRRLSNVEFPFMANAETTLGHELDMSSSNPLLGWNSMAEFLPQFSSNKGRVSPERVPQLSPRTRSPGPRSRIHSGTVSPLHPKFASDFSTGRHDENSNVSVHPLPLPPRNSHGATPLSPNSPSAGQRSPGRLETSVTPGRWIKGKRLGSGTFGTVYEGFNRETGDMCAMKEVPLIPDDSQSSESIKQLGQEINLLSRLKHHNIVQYYGSETLEDRLYIYLELVPGGSIYKILREYGPLKEPVIRIYTRQILSGLAYLHSTNTVHRDIKGANLLVDTSGRVKLADFGMAKHISGPSCPRSFKGSPYWMAPEIMTQSSPGHDLAVDIWSLGCTIIEMATGKPPWSEYEGAAAMFKVFKNEVPPIPEFLSSEGRDFVRCCLRRNPAERATAFQLLDHLFVRDTSHHEGSDLLTSATAAIKPLGTKEKSIYSNAAVTLLGMHSGNGKQHQLPSASAHSQMGAFVPSSNAPLSPCSTLESHSLSPSRSSMTLPTVPSSGNASIRSMASCVNEGHLNSPVSPNPRNGSVGITQMVDRSEACSDFKSYPPMFHRTEVSPRRRNCRSDDIMQKKLCKPSQDLDHSRQHYLPGIAPDIPSQQPPRRASYPNIYS